MNLEERLERLADRTPPGEPSDVLATARDHADVVHSHRNRRAPILVAAVAMITVAVGVVAVLVRDEGEPVIVAAPEEDAVGGEEVADQQSPFADLPVRAWVPLPPSPLDPRTRATAVWTGSEVVVLGGTDTACPPNALCTAPQMLRDAAAFDPVTWAWRSVSSPPPQQIGSLIAFDGDVVGVGSDGQLWTYSPTADSWGSRGLPPELLLNDGTEIGWDPRTWWFPGVHLLAAGDRLVAWTPDGQVWTRQPSGETWEVLPRSPIGEMIEADLVWDGRRLVLIGSLAPAGEAAPSRFATWSEAEGWRELPELDVGGGARWLGANGLVVSPVSGTGSDVPSGGIVDADTGEWSPLPPIERPEGLRWPTPSLVVGDRVLGDHAALLDPEAGTWELIPFEPLQVEGLALTAVRDAIFVWGGHTWEDGRAPDLRNTGAILRPSRSTDPAAGPDD